MQACRSSYIDTNCDIINGKTEKKPVAKRLSPRVTWHHGEPELTQLHQLNRVDKVMRTGWAVRSHPWRHTEL